MKSYQTIKTAVKFVCAAFFGSSAFAQFDSATLLGTVRDANEAAVPNAAVTLKNTATGSSVAATTDAEGNYQFLNIKIGTHEISAESEGFSSFAGRARRI